MSGSSDSPFSPRAPMHISRFLPLCLLGVVSASADDSVSAHIAWKRLIDKTAEEHEIFVSQATTMSLDGIYTWVPALTFGLGDNRDAALALFRELDGRFTRWAHENGGRSHLKEFRAKYGSPPPPGGAFIGLFSFANGNRIQMTYCAPSEDARSSLTITFFDSEKIQAEK